MDGNQDFEDWARDQRALLGVDIKPAPAEPLPPIEDALSRWKREAEAAEEQRAAARAEHRTIEQRALREQRRHEIRLAEAQNDGGVDWTAVLTALASALETINQRLDDLEARVGNNGTKLEAEHIDLPRFLAPKHGPALGWPADIRFSQPLATIRHGHE
jgi:hypothetical protein